MKEMNQLTVVTMKGVNVINSTEVADMIGKAHKELLRDIRVYCGYLGESKIALTDFFIESTYTTAQNKIMPCYLITRKGCEMIANKMTGQKGTIFTAEFINAFHEMENKIIHVDSYMIDDPIRRAERWIEEQKEKRALELKIEADKPKVEFAEQVHDSTNLSSIEDFAKALHDEDIHIGRNKLYKWLRENKYLMHDNVLYQQFIDRGLFAVTESTYSAKGEIRTAYTTRITGKGQLYITAKLRQYWKT